MTIQCPHHEGCEAWTGEERREGDDYQWECDAGLTWFADETGDNTEEEGNRT